ncbi:hypothetical protein TVAG_296760 [Trichomonas vaginalis G3]|uniref:Uncharacterized protein n=1 Tax=Trichomonas vaginalis (strain ATCC PRA-98 / G3) TaxID=412133 RepID=A2FUT0_TRIV3|nr:amelogenin-related protein family [Trichomonas vaginalis G3]EAX91344.1 hypothetical protein TVAG_296760 [Trichomonas vaginalis G3]KAI5485599.1 amelogenin-related protein family [Trichomonas vaginalis G3]|eukprot:XP_001304274.1 hypothetical protein [Trichomonas vaginalis G3]
MLGFLLAQTLSFYVNKTGFYSEYVSSSSKSKLIIDLSPPSEGNYYIVFSSVPIPLILDSTSIIDRVFKITSLTTAYIVSSDISLNVSFGVFLIPSSYDSLEFWVQPTGMSDQQYTIPTRESSTTKTHLLCIISDDPFEISVHNSDSNIYGGTNGELPTSQYFSFTNAFKLVTLKYVQYADTTPSIYYTLRLYSNKINDYTLKGYDSSKEFFVFDFQISITSLAPGKASMITYPSISYGPQSESFSTSGKTYIVPESTIIVFTNPAKVKGVAKVGDTTTLGILGDTKIRAIEFRKEGTLTLSSDSSTSAYFVVYNISVIGCDRTAIISGTQKFKVKIETNGILYCAVSAFYTGKSEIQTDEVQHVSLDYYGDEIYPAKSNSETVYKPSITGFFGYTQEKITFDNDGSSNDDNYVIDGSSSDYNFYYISKNDYSKINTYKSFGSAGNGLPGYAIAIIVIAVIGLIIGIIICICCCCCGKSCCCSNSKVSGKEHSSSSSSNRQTKHPAPNSSTTVVVQTSTNTAVSPSSSPSYYSPPPAQQQQQQQYYQPPPSYSPPQQPYPYGAPPQQAYPYGAPPQQAYSYGAPPPYAPPPTYSAAETKNANDNPYN